MFDLTVMAKIVMASAAKQPPSWRAQRSNLRHGERSEAIWIASSLCSSQ
jgi:hypothetical protein